MKRGGIGLMEGAEERGCVVEGLDEESVGACWAGHISAALKTCEAVSLRFDTYLTTSHAFLIAKIISLLKR